MIISDEARRAADESRRAQGLPAQIDSAILARIATIMRLADPRIAQPAKPSRRRKSRR